MIYKDKIEALKELDEKIDIYKREKNITGGFQKRLAKWTRDEIIRLLNGLLHFPTNLYRWVYVKKNFVYGFYLTRTVKNSHYSAFKYIRKSNLFFEYLKEAILWTPKDYPLENHFDNLKFKISSSEPLYKIYSKIHSLDVARFKPVTSKDFSLFYNDLLKKKGISESQFNTCMYTLRAAENMNLSNKPNDFLNATYIPLDVDLPYDKLSALSKPATIFPSFLNSTSKINRSPNMSLVTLNEKMDRHIETTFEKLNQLFLMTYKMKRDLYELKQICSNKKNNHDSITNIDDDIEKVDSSDSLSSSDCL